MRRLVFFLFLGCVLLLSEDFTGTGFGQNIKEAKHEALADLSQSIKAEVRSNFSTSKSQNNNAIDSKAISNIIVSSNLPILGAEFELFDNRDSVEALVALSPIKVQKLYTKKLQNLSREIQVFNKKAIQSDKAIVKEELLSKLLELLNEFDRYHSVAIIIGVKEIPKVNITKASVESELLEMRHNLNSLEVAGKYLAEAFKAYNKIYFYPPKVSQSHEITPFAKAFSLHVKPYLHATNKLNRAQYRLIGEYSASKKGLIVSYDLIDSQTHERVHSKTLTLNPKAYSQYRVEAKNISFDKLLHEGIVISSSLKASLATNKGTEELLFTQGEEIELLLKLNKMGYYYLIGYTQTDNAKHAYLLELNEAPGDQRFMGFVNADDANRWISIGAFIVEKPFGIESLQLIASNKKIKKLPTHYFDKKSTYYLIGKNPKEGLAKSRGLIRKKNKKQEISEAVLLFTTSK
jgi:hypothetical protein